MQPNPAFPRWELQVVSVTVNVPLAVDMEVIWMILKSLERSWVCPLCVPLKFLDLEPFSVESWTQHRVLDVVGCAWAGDRSPEDGI